MMCEGIFAIGKSLRLRVTPSLLRFIMQKKTESMSGRSLSPWRAGSPPGGSILMTSAPSHASVSVQLGPASYWVRSRTRIPSSAFAIVVAPRVRGVWGGRPGLTAAAVLR